MRLTISAVMLFAVSCCSTRNAPDVQRPCVSSCGMLFEDFPNGAMSCNQLQEAEDVTLKAFDEKLCKEDPRFCREAACKAIFGWQIKSEDGVAWSTDDGPLRVGESQPEVKIMILARTSDWRHGSYPHELAHVVQDGVPPEDWEETEAEAALGNGHRGWTEHGVYGTIDAIRHGAY